MTKEIAMAAVQVDVKVTNFPKLELRANRWLFRHDWSLRSLEEGGLIAVLITDLPNRQDCLAESVSAIRRRDTAHAG
jgi:hypothetical protein